MPQTKERTPARREDADYLKRFGEKLSATTRRAHWIGDQREHEDRRGQTLATRNHDVIRRWAEERGAAPATIRSSRQDGRPRVLRFDFPDYGGQSLERIHWPDWFRTFDERKLTFLYQEHKRDGAQSNFFRLDSPEREDG